VSRPVATPAPADASSRRTRLDACLVRLGQAESREKAQALVMAGRVLLNGAPATKPGTPVRDGARVEVLAGRDRVGRGGLKLEGALDAFSLDPRGRVAVDVGASTGGFTEALLARGAGRVYAVDVGRAQLHETLRADPRVVVLERTNARTLSRREIPEPCSLAVMDVSFISALKILPALRERLEPGADVVLLVKPQFELERRLVGRGGLVRDEALHARALREVALGAAALGYAVRGACASPIAGSEGNREFFLLLGNGGGGLDAAEIERLAERTVAS
jgi:23S rRNA (cytidine1920-2'-O)/16S rRNA (cytidine1409-2'-O)-methyltransferase